MKDVPQAAMSLETAKQSLVAISVLLIVLNLFSLVPGLDQMLPAPLVEWISLLLSLALLALSFFIRPGTEEAASASNA